MSINQKLKQLYQINLPIIEKIADELKDDFDGPLLMHCWDEEFNNAEYKILFIGQEHTNTCWFANDAIEAPLEWYQNFELGKNYNSPFWRAVKQLNKTLNRNTSHKPNFLSTNVSKYATTEGKSVGYDIHYRLVKDLNFNILANEIEIIKPDAIIFLSGSNYDKWIEIQFSDALTFDTPLHSNVPIKELSIVKCKGEKLLFPKHTYRTFHPMSLLNNKWHFLNIIALDIMGFSFEKTLEKLNTDLENLRHVKAEKINDCFGSKENTIIINVPEWEYFNIGFQFEEAGFSSFFYGIMNKHIDLENQDNIKAINGLQANNCKTSKLWPYWDWFEHRDWNKKTFEEIENGDFTKKMQKVIDNILDNTKGLKL